MAPCLHRSEVGKLVNQLALGVFAVTHSDTPTARGLIQSVRRLEYSKKLMRHADIRTTMNIYGDAVTPDMREAHGKIVSLALNGMETACKPS